MSDLDKVKQDTLNQITRNLDPKPGQGVIIQSKWPEVQARQLKQIHSELKLHTEYLKAQNEILGEIAKSLRVISNRVGRTEKHIIELVKNSDTMAQSS